MAGNNNNNNNNRVTLVTLVLCCVIGICSAKSYVVGGSTGWTIPTSPSFYSSWAAQQKLLVGDVLVFTFPVSAHTVAEVSKSNYDACTSAATLGPVMTTAPANVTLTKPGTHYFICTITGHCGANQKLTVTVAASTPAPVATPTPSPSPKSSPTRSPKTSPAPGPSPKSSTTPSPSPTPSVVSPTVAPTPAAPGPGAQVPTTVPAASGPGVEPGTAPPPAGNSAVVSGVTLFSFLSIVSFALLF